MRSKCVGDKRKSKPFVEGKQTPKRFWMNRNFLLGTLFWASLAVAGVLKSNKKKEVIENEVLQSIMPPYGKTLDAFLIPRFATSPTIEIVRKFIRDYFATHLKSWHAQIDTFEEETPIGKVRFQNLIFTRNVLAKRKVILAAHYDSKYSLNERNGALPDGFVGATDSAWPCALLLYLARMIDLYNPPGNAEETFQIVFFDGEESIRYKIYLMRTGIGGPETHCMEVGDWQNCGSTTKRRLKVSLTHHLSAWMPFPSSSSLIF